MDKIIKQENNDTNSKELVLFVNINNIINKLNEIVDYINSRETNSFGYAPIIPCEHIYEYLNNTTGAKRCVKCGNLI